jgi:uncharacterized membrane protein YgaE (UPF0421/DUF939 family)
MSNLILSISDSLKIAWQSLLAIFIGIGAIYLVILLFSALNKKNNNKQK